MGPESGRATEESRKAETMAATIVSETNLCCGRSRVFNVLAIDRLCIIYCFLEIAIAAVFMYLYDLDSYFGSIYLSIIDLSVSCQCFHL